MLCALLFLAVAGCGDRHGHHDIEQHVQLDVQLEQRGGELRRGVMPLAAAALAARHRRGRRWRHRGRRGPRAAARPRAAGVATAATAAPAERRRRSWVGTWTTGPQLTETNNNPPEPGLTNNTLRQVIYTSIGGKGVRLLLSNEFGDGPVTMESVHIAESTTADGINVAADHA